MEVLFIILGVLSAFIAVLLIRAALYNPKKVSAEKPKEVELDREKITQNMVDMIKCKTVSYPDKNLIDYAEFEKFRLLLKERYPNIHKISELKNIGTTGLLYKISGESSERPTVLMAHYDVVPVEEDLWTRPAFEGVIENGMIFGRGTLDTKGTLLGIMEALELKLSEGFTPENDIYLSFSGEEEISGEDCPKIVEHLKKNGIDPALILDEGGAIVKNVFPGVKKQAALIGIAEKGSADFDFSLPSSGGHASTPPPHTNLGRLAIAATRLENNPFPGRFTEPVAEMFDTMGRNSTFLFKIIFANIRLFLPLLKFFTKKTGGEMNAMFRTTLAITKMSGSKAYNVIPPKAEMGINMRLLPGDTLESVEKRIRKTLKNDQIKVTLRRGDNPSICSDTKSEGYKKLEKAINATWENTIVSPYLMMACSDSRHYSKISDKVFRFSAMRLSKEERGMIHGNDERIPVDTLLETVKFYISLIETL